MAPRSTGVRSRVYRADGSYVKGATSKSDGSYHVVVDPGSYRIYAQKDPAYEPEYYDDVTTFAAATPVDVDADNDRTDIDISLRRRPSISGTMTPCGYAYALSADSSRYYSGQSTCAGDSGTFEIFVDPGSYSSPSIRTRRRSVASGGTVRLTALARRRSSVDYGNDATGLAVTFEELEWIEGHDHDADRRSGRVDAGPGDGRHDADVCRWNVLRVRWHLPRLRQRWQLQGPVRLRLDLLVREICDRVVE